MRGSCLCGGVTFEVDGAVHARLVLPLHHVQGDLRRHRLGNGPRADERRPRAHRPRADHDVPADEGLAKSFCSVCGSNLLGTGWPDSDVTGVRLPALDEPYEGKGDMHIYVRSVAPWETLPDDGLPRHEQGAR